MNFNLNTREEISLELKGHVATSCVKDLLPSGLVPLVINEATPICLQLGHVEQMNWSNMPLLKMHFDKALWHIAVLKGTTKGWFLTSCDLSNSFLYHFNNIFFRYPIRDANFSFFEKRKSLITQHIPATGGEMRCHVELGIDEQPKEIISDFYIKRRNILHTIQITEQQPAFCRLSKADIIKDEISREIFGLPVQWEDKCYVYRGKISNWKEIKVE